jgi:uncharacterized MAPEG superfamily protein
MMTTSHAVIASGILTLLMLLVASAYCSKAWTPGGVEVAFGNRESVAPPYGIAGRADRAAKNMLEGMVMLLAVVLAAHLAGKGAQAATGATVFFWARLLYWPTYMAGIIYLRTALWFVSIIGLGMIVWAVW